LKGFNGTAECNARKLLSGTEGRRTGLYISLQNKEKKQFTSTLGELEVPQNGNRMFHSGVL
jgi:hypothetical protein